MDEAWLNHFIPEAKRQSVEWEGAGKPQTQNDQKRLSRLRML